MTVKAWRRKFAARHYRLVRRAPDVGLVVTGLLTLAIIMLALRHTG